MEAMMRDDMFKVIVERPRWGSHTRAREGRLYRASEDVPNKIGMKQGYVHRKSLNENLAPLARWLASQVNRPWDKVYAELCATIDRRSTVQEHIFAHIDQLVERETRIVDGKVHVIGRWPHKLQPIEESWLRLYVHPVTGILRHNKHRITRSQKKREASQRVDDEFAAKQRDLSDTEQLHKIDGIWYHITLAMMAAPYGINKNGDEPSRFVYPQYWDVLQSAMVSRQQRETNGRPIRTSPHISPYAYAAVKRQLSNAELKRHQLKNDTNDNAGNSRRFSFSVSQLPTLIKIMQTLASTGITAHFYLKRKAGWGVYLFLLIR
jgi:hypothetical protein